LSWVWEAELSRVQFRQLAVRTEPVHAPGWPPPESFPVSECLSAVLDEEYLPRQFAERDLAVLESKAR